MRDGPLQEGRSFLARITCIICICIWRQKGLPAPNDSEQASWVGERDPRAQHLRRHLLEGSCKGRVPAPHPPRVRHLPEHRALGAYDPSPCSRLPPSPAAFQASAAGCDPPALAMWAPTFTPGPLIEFFSKPDAPEARITFSVLQMCGQEGGAA